MEIGKGEIAILEAEAEEGSLLDEESLVEMTC